VSSVRFTGARLAGLLAVFALGLLVSMALAAAFGESHLDLHRALFEAGSRERFVLLEVRAPEIALAAIIGASLAVSGCALQALLRNPLADPFVLGVSGGAALGATLALVLGGAALAASMAAAASTLPSPLGSVLAGLLSRSPTTLAAIAGALLATLVVYSAGSFKDRLSTYGALLAGVVFNALASAVITFLKALSPPDRVGDVLYWLAGRLDYPYPATVVGTAVFEAVGLGVIFLYASDLNLLSLGDEGAASLGVEVQRVRRVLFFATSLCVAAAVSVSGLVGFVGLIVPQALRLWLGPDQRLLLPCSAVAGAAFLVVADLVARVLFAPLGQGTPVGVVTALIGAPVFLWLLRRTGQAL